MKLTFTIDLKDGADAHELIKVMIDDLHDCSAHPEPGHSHYDYADIMSKQFRCAARVMDAVRKAIKETVT